MRVPSLWKPSPRGGEQQSCEMQSCTPAHFRVKAAARREIRRFNISDESEHGGRRRKEIQKPWVFGGVLSPISFAAERNGAAGGKKEIILPSQAKVGRAGARNLPAAAERNGAAGGKTDHKVQKKPRRGWRGFFCVFCVLGEREKSHKEGKFLWMMLYYPAKLTES